MAKDSDRAAAGGAGAGAGVVIENTEVRGNITLTGNASSRIIVSASTVRASLIITDNALRSRMFVSGNTIAGDLVCERNTPDPEDDVVPNDVGGVKIGQCAGL